MTYELAKQLKDAGFSQAGRNEDGYRWLNNEGVYLPLLEELIEACGERFALHHNLRNDGLSWCAWQINSNPQEREAYDVKAYGHTPAEAVARLWLALNKPLTDQGGEVIK